MKTLLTILLLVIFCSCSKEKEYCWKCYYETVIYEITPYYYSKTGWVNDTLYLNRDTVAIRTTNLNFNVNNVTKEWIDEFEKYNNIKCWKIKNK